MAPVVSLIQRDDAAPLTFGSANVWRKDGGRKWAETRTEEMRLQNQYASRASVGSLKLNSTLSQMEEIPSLKILSTVFKEIYCILRDLKAHNLSFGAEYFVF
jgi:hypothetical protein